MDVLIHISQQLSNSTTLAYTPTEFTVSPSVTAVNVLFFLSLALVLIDAFLAMLVKSWLQEFDRGWRKYTVANLRAKERERRLQGLERWKLAELVALLPILIQASLLLFCIGLLVLLFPIHLISAICSSVALLAGLTLYAFTTYVSIFDSYAPFSSPVSRGLIILINALQTRWSALTHNSQGLISHVLSYISHPMSTREHKPTRICFIHSLPGSDDVALLPLDRSNEVVKDREAVPQSQSQIDYQTYASILERLVITTPEAVENIPVFLDLLDQPVKDLTLRPSNVSKWKELLHTTMRLLGDPSTFSDSATRTIARTLIFCYGRGDLAKRELSQRLQYHFDHMSLGQTDKYKPLNSLFASSLHYHFAFHSGIPDLGTVMRTIVSLEPSNAADMELFWMVNTFHSSFRQGYDLQFICGQALQFFAAVLTYVASTEQNRRSQVPLTASVIHAMYTIGAAIFKDSVAPIERPYLLVGTTLSTSESMFETFYREDALNLWSDDCIRFASALLRPHTSWPTHHATEIWKFQLPLIAALHIDSTKASAHPSGAFTLLLRSMYIPNIREHTWGGLSVYNQAKLAGYWYMVLFKAPIDHMDSPIQYIGHVIMRTIEHCSKLRLSALHLLDFSVRQLCIIAPSSSILHRSSTSDSIMLTTPDGHDNHHADGPLNCWVLLHLDTLFPHSSLLHASELEELEWADTPGQVHIAKARLSCYDSLQEDEHQETEQLRPEPHLLRLFLWSTDYSVCTSAFKWCLNLAAIDQSSSVGDIPGTGMFIPEVMGWQWIVHLGHVLCGGSDIFRSWELLAEYLAPKWAMLPPSWCCDFAFVFLFSNVHLPYMPEQPAYQFLAQALTYQACEEQLKQAPLPFLGAMLERIKHHLDWNQLTFLETWLAQLPDDLKDQDAYFKLEIILVTQRQQIEEETLDLFAELPMNYSN